MATVTMKVGPVKLNIAGFRRMRTTRGAYALARRAAQGIARAAGPGFVVDEPGRKSLNRARVTVHPDTAEAQRRDLRDLTLIRAIDGGRNI